MMVGADGGRQHGAPIELAREPDFALGRVRVRPSLTEVIVEDEILRLQPRVMQVLVALARASGEVVSRDELLASCWGGLSIGDDAINRCIGRLRRLAETEAPGAFTIETLARVGYRLRQPSAQSLIVPAQLDGEAAPRLSGAPSRAFNQLPVFAMLLGGLLLASGLVVAWFASGEPGWPQALEGIAITPFDSASSDPTARNVADGAKDRLEGSLAKAGLRTITLDNHSLSRLRQDVAAVQLGAAFSLSGRVQESGGSFDINVALDDARRHEVLWSANLSRPVNQLQTLKEQLAAKVTSVLHCALDTADFTATKLDDRDLALHLNACDWQTGNGGAAEGRALIDRLVKREPRFAQGWGGLAVLNVDLAADLSPSEADDAFKEARADAAKALALNPKVGSAYVAMAAMVSKGHFWDQQMLLKKGLSASPDDALINHAEAELLSSVGRFHDAVSYTERAANLDPWQPFWLSELASYLAHDGRLPEAREVIDQAIQTWPDDDSIQGTRLGVEARYGDTDLALKMLSEPQSLRQWSPALIEDWKQYIHSRNSHDPRVIKAYADRLLAQLRVGGIDINRVLVRLNTLGATEAAYSAVQSSLPTSVDTEALFRFPPGGQGMWRDPRFIPMARRLGLVDFWRKSGLWPDFCDMPNRPYDCRIAAAEFPVKDR